MADISKVVASDGTTYDIKDSVARAKTDLFECTYGTTTQSEINTAVAAGKLPYIYYNNNYYIYSRAVSSIYGSYSVFASLSFDPVTAIIDGAFLYCMNSTWNTMTGTTPMKPTTPVDSSVSSTSTIHIGTEDPDDVDFTSWSVGELYIYVKMS